MSPYEIILKKREGKSLSYDELDYFINGFTKKTIPDYQMAALAMAIYFQGMTFEETADLTKIMVESGEYITFPESVGTTVDKHSTGGVGDKISIPLIGIVASAGIPVPMIAGRGLGHTGGTIDKLESIPGFRTDLSTHEFVEQVKSSGCALIGQTSDIAPADKAFYALRDVTATVSSIPLMTASIMSKKLAEGAQAFTLDVKYGSGAFMNTVEEAEKLAVTLVKTGHLSGRNMIAYLTNMDQPLGNKIGNWLEIEESLETLRGSGPKDLLDLTYLFAGTMIFQGGKAESIDAGIALAKELTESGKAYNKFIEMVNLQGGDISVFESPKHFRRVETEIEIKAPSSGYIHQIDALKLGQAAVVLGAGREKKEDVIDLFVGFEIYHQVGDQVKAGDKLATIYMNNPEKSDDVISRVKSAFVIKDVSCEALPLVVKMVTPEKSIEYSL